MECPCFYISDADSTGVGQGLERVLVMQRALFKTASVLFTFLLLGCAPALPQGHDVERSTDNNEVKAEPMIGYDEFLLRIEKIHIGNHKDHVEKILGKPQSASEIIWNYDLKRREGFPGVPPASGTTVFVSVEFVFENEQVKDIRKNWIDLTGPVP